MEQQGTGADEYYRKLEQFEEKCYRLIANGQPYLAVILCHELYRFTYPVEPYVAGGFTHDHPVEYITRLITRLNDLADTFPTIVVPYTFDIKQTGESGHSLEKETSDLYSGLWNVFDRETLTQESFRLIKNRIPETVVTNAIRGHKVLDMGCGSGRYSIALSVLGAREVVAVDYQAKAFVAAKEYCEKNGLMVKFQESNVLDLPFENESFDFVFCNGVLHHTSNLEKGIREYLRVLKKGGMGFLYLYGSGGIFWITRDVTRRIFTKIPLDYTKTVLNLMGTPQNRFIFCDTWYVPVEMHVREADLHRILKETGLLFEKVISTNAFDIDYPVHEGKIPGARDMWGEGDHRYILTK